MLDLNAYKEWNPFIIDVEGASHTLSLGDRFVLKVRWSDGGEVSSPERVTLIEAPVNGKARFGYRYDHVMHKLALMQATRIQTISSLASGETRYQSEETFKGLLSRFTPLKKVQAGFDAHAAALKSRSEAPLC